jgi:hypothetical protein
MYPHQIRLRGPWECEPLTQQVGESPVPPPRRVTMPCRLEDLGDFSGRVRFRRAFGYPGRIDADERVWLTLDGIEVSAEVSLNGQLLGQCDRGSFEFDVTALLKERNRLDIVFEALPKTCGLWEEVALEIRRTAFLRDVRARITAAGGDFTLSIQGEVVGRAEGLLELYVLHKERSVAYQTVEADPAGRSFQVEVHTVRANDEGSSARVRVELVNGAVVWYAVDVPLSGLEVS